MATCSDSMDLKTFIYGPDAGQNIDLSTNPAITIQDISTINNNMHCLQNLIKSQKDLICMKENDKLALGLGLFDLFLLIILVTLTIMYYRKKNSTH
jgi:hypothetical protein